MRHRLAWVAAILLPGLLFGCATPPPPVPEGYAGPTATISDSTQGGGNARSGRFFSLARIDNGPALRTSLDRSKSASFGQGFRLSVLGQTWRVKAGAAKLKLVGRTAYAAPVQELFAGSRLRSVEGEVEVVLKADGHYVVNGILDAYRREIWLEDETTHEPVGPRIVAAPDAAALAKSVASGMFTCCNLHYDDTLISDENFEDLPFIPAGARVVILGYSRKNADVLIEGRPMELNVYVGDNIPGKKMSPQELATRLVVDVDPTAQLAGYPKDVQAAIRAGKVMPGMTKAQVLMSLGYPWIDKTPLLESRAWAFRATDDDDAEYNVIWGSDDRVQSVEGSSKVTRLVMP